MSQKVVKKSKHRGAVLIETALFFVTMIGLFFSLSDVASGIREMNLVTEAARHGARSLAARTKTRGVCADTITAQNEISCAGLGAAASPGIIALTPVWSACSFLQVAGLKYQNFTVSTATITEELNQNTGLPDCGAAKKGTNSVFFASVTVRRAIGSSCISCRFMGFSQASQTVVFPLNPYLQDGYNQCRTMRATGCT